MFFWTRFLFGTIEKTWKESNAFEAAIVSLWLVLGMLGPALIVDILFLLPAFIIASISGSDKDEGPKP